MRKKKILHFITSLARAGAENILELIATQHVNNYEHFVVSLGKDNARLSQFKASGCATYLCEGNVLPLLYRKMPFEPDIVMGWMYHGNLAALYYQKRRAKNAKLVWSVRQGLDNYYDLKQSTRFVVKMGVRFSPKTYKISYNGYKSLKQHESFGYDSSKSFFFPNGVDTDKFAPLEKKRTENAPFPIPEDAIVVMQSARFTPEKNYPLFFSVMSEIMNKNTRVHGVCMGLGLESHKKNTILNECKIPKSLHSRFHFMGLQSQPHQLLNRADIFCQTSSTEAFSNSLVEAMSTGLPIVCSDAGDSPKILENSGLIFPSNSHSELLGNISQLIENKTLREELGTAARKRALREYSKDKLFKNFDLLVN